MSTDNTPNTPAAAAPAAPAGPKPARNTAGVIALVALGIAILTAGYVVYRDPPWGRLAKYNFSSPDNALRSDVRMRANGDIPALIEMETKLDRKDEKERLATLDVKRTADFEGKTALFIQYKIPAKGKRKEEERKEVVWYEKDEASGFWRRTFVDSSEVRAADAQLAKDIDAWSGRGGFPMPGGIGE